MRIFLILSALAIGLHAGTPPRPARAEVKNVILMIGDGAGYNVWDAASMYQGRWDAERSRSRQIFDGKQWVRVGCATYSLNLATSPQGTDVQDPELVYDAARAWDQRGGYRWLTSTYTDSAAAGTALATGVKTFNNGLNWSDLDEPIGPTLAHIGKEAGRSVGVVTDVPWSHATPAALGGARARSRNDYEAIANQMLGDGVLDVIMGAGNPDYDRDGKPVKGEKNYQYVGGQETWEALEAARATPDGTHLGLRPVATKEEFEALVSGPTPQRIVGTAQVARTLQYGRREQSPKDVPYGDPFLTNVPSLAVMTRAALNVLDDHPDGLLLVVEGGAIDWANHDNHGGRMIEEQIAFVEAIEAVVQWVETASNWDETLLVVTADHETGLIWGPESDEEPFQPIVDRGPGKMPGLRYHATTHSNSLVPVFAKGSGSQWFSELIAGTDPVYGDYVDNTDVYHVLARALGRQAAIPAGQRESPPEQR